MPRESVSDTRLAYVRGAMEALMATGYDVERVTEVMTQLVITAEEAACVASACRQGYVAPTASGVLGVIDETNVQPSK